MALTSGKKKRIVEGGKLLAAVVFLVGLGLLPMQALSQTGDVATGKALFTGEQRMENGAPPCISCHNAGVGKLGGGVLGPDLTMILADVDKEYFVASDWINGGGSPVMGPIFANKEITDDEVLHLRAFFKDTSEKGLTASASGLFPVIGIAGAICMIILFTIIWGGRYSRRNLNTAHDALWRNYDGKGGK